MQIIVYGARHIVRSIGIEEQGVVPGIAGSGSGLRCEVRVPQRHHVARPVPPGVPLKRETPQGLILKRTLELFVIQCNYRWLKEISVPAWPLSVPKCSGFVQRVESDLFAVC